MLNMILELSDKKTGKSVGKSFFVNDGAARLIKIKFFSKFMNIGALLL